MRTLLMDNNNPKEPFEPHEPLRWSDRLWIIGVSIVVLAIYVAVALILFPSLHPGHG